MTESTAQLSEEARAEIGALLEKGRKIEAIKRYREATGVGLAEAKKAVEAMAAPGPDGGGHAAVKPSSGCAGMLLLLVSVAALLVAL